MATTTTPRGDGRQAQAGRGTTERAEQTVEDWTEKVAGWVSRAAERTREEVEDIWAEAQSVRKSE